MTELTPIDVGGRLAQSVARFHRRMLPATGGLSHGLLASLATVAKRGPIRLADLAQIELVSAPSITRTVAELEARGLVARTADPGDGRASLIDVTPSGLDAIVRARAERAAVLAALLEDLSPEQLATVAAALPALEIAAQLDAPVAG